MASLTESQVAPATAREGFDTRNQDLNVACDDTQEMAYDGWVLDEVDGMCQDCCEHYAVRRFHHMRNGEFFLCDDCFLGGASHEDDYGNAFLTREEALAAKVELERRMVAEMEAVEAVRHNRDFIDPGEQDDDFQAEEEWDDAEEDWNEFDDGRRW